MRGFTLIEVLVALLLLSTGVVGLAQAQTKVLMWSAEAGYRPLAALKALDMLETIHARGGRDVPYESGIWQAELEALLPHGEGDVSGNGPYTVTVRWLDRHAQGGVGEVVLHLSSGG